MVNGARIFYRSARSGRQSIEGGNIMTPILNLHNIDVTEFLAVLDTCEGNVYLVTNEGDRLNLKSKLCQLVGLARCIEGGKITEASLVCENVNDESKLFRFNTFGDVGSARVG